MIIVYRIVMLLLIATQIAAYCLWQSPIQIIVGCFLACLWITTECFYKAA